MEVSLITGLIMGWLNSFGPIPPMVCNLVFSTLRKPLAGGNLDSQNIKPIVREIPETANSLESIENMLEKS